ncbi:MAG: SDR family NAD(P)-dependent oxidoreductase [Actinobacteria bacterium]|nr:SDR family NAD(P)-dependent oxidoreductase [Actinomycetota bacterium]
MAAIAVVGVALRFPGAETPEAFWQLLAAGRDAVGPLPLHRQPLMLGDSRGLPPAGWLANVAGFDAPLFQISPREAELLDPQQRLFLEVSWEALERAGLAPTGLAGTATGVFVGVGSGDYAHLAVAAGRQQEPHFHSGTTASMIAARTSYLLNLHGPSLTVDTACSSGLVAVHLACQSLRSGECQLAIAGGANLILSAGSTQVVLGTGTLSADGRSKTFDQRADGFARGEGIAAVVLKPLAAAQRDGDPIWGVIRGSATNHDGHAKAGLTAPSPQAQAECLRAALAQAGLSARELDLVEAHGTGTALGDPLEVEGLLRAFAPDDGPEGGPAARGAVFAGRCPVFPGRCALGSVKSNLGHLEAAAGLAGLVKALLALRARQLPATLHVEEPNRLLRLETSPFWINDRLRPWPASDHPRRAAVSALGLGGANAHLVLEEPPLLRAASPTPRWPVPILPLSAQSDESLAALVAHYRDWLNRDARTPLAELCYTAAAGRPLLRMRLAIVARARDQVCDKLQLLKDWPARDQLRGSLIFAADTRDEAACRQLAADALVPRLNGLSDEARLELARAIDSPTVREALAARGLTERDRAADQASLALTAEESVELAAAWALAYVIGGAPRAAAWYGAGSSLTAGNPLPRSANLPTYPFAQRDYWPWDVARGLPVEPIASLSKTAAPGARPDASSAVETVAVKTAAQARVETAAERMARVAGWFARPGWVDAPLVEHTARAPQLSGRWLIVAPTDDVRSVAAALTARLTAAGGQVELITESPGDADASRDAAGWQALLAAGPRPAGVIDLWDLLRDLVPPEAESGSATSDDADAAREGVLALFEFARGWQGAGEQWDEAGRGQATESRAETAHGATTTWWQVHALAADGGVRPTAAARGAFARAAVCEHGGLATCSLGLPSQLTADERTSADQASEAIVARLVDELLSGPALPQQVRYATGAAGTLVRQVPALTPLDPRELPVATPAVRAGGVYLITGGLGSVGLALAEALAAAGAGTLVLWSRSAWSEADVAPTSDAEQSVREDAVLRADITAREEAAARDAERRAALARLRRAGVTLELLHGELADTEFVARQVRALVARHGRLDGIVHAAGQLTDRLLARHTAAEITAILAPKLAGTAALLAATAELPLDWLVCCSSLAARNPTAGQASYAAANAWLDARCEQLTSAGRPILALDWGYWGDSRVVARKPHYRRLLEAPGLAAIDTPGGQAALLLVLGRASGLLVVQPPPRQPLAWRAPSFTKALARCDRGWRRRHGAALGRLVAGTAALDRLAARGLMRLLARADLFTRLEQSNRPPGVRRQPTLLSRDEIAARLQLAPQFARWLEQALRQLVAAGWLEEVATGQSVAQYRALRAFDAHARLAPAARRVARRYPEVAPQLGLLRRAIKQLAGVLSGQVDPLEILFPDGSLAPTEALYRDSLAGRYYGRLAATALGQAVAQWRGQRAATAQRDGNIQLRILEVGGGIGGTTDHLLKALGVQPVSYHFTDLSAALVQQARRRWGNIPANLELVFDRLDLETSPLEQGFALGQYDLIVAANVLHATADLGRTLTHLQELLAPGGLVLAVEATAARLWGELTFGLTEGWWRFADPARRTAGPLLSLDAWRSALAETGFALVTHAPAEADAGQHLLVIQNVGATAATTSGTAPRESAPSELARGVPVASPPVVSEVERVELSLSTSTAKREAKREATPSHAIAAEGANVSTLDLAALAGQLGAELAAVLHQPAAQVDTTRAFQEQGSTACWPWSS